MKFYQFLCQFVKISPFFPESLEKSLDKVVSRGEKNFSVHKKYMNFFQYRKTALDEHLYKLSAGRSMVEMLGVLAIIGILSVGAISGYSKAMTKYKLNKHTQQISELLTAVTSTISQKYYEKTSSGTDVAGLLNTLKSLPDGVSYISKNVVKTSLGISIELYVGKNGNNLAFIIHYNKAQSSVDACVNTFQMLKSIQPETSSLTTVWIERPYYYYYRQNCKSTSPCLPNMTTHDFYEACQKSYNEFVNNGSLYFYQWIQFDFTK